MQILRADGHKRMPWKNGRGETVEIAIFPAGTTVDTFDWRISMATVAEDGPFSIFPGIDRTLSILEGNGMELTVDGRQDTTLTGETAPYSFAADAPTTARLLGGPIVDLNVMTRRGSFSHSVETFSGTAVVTPGDGTTLILCHSGIVGISHEATSERLAPLDCAIIPPGRRVELTGTGSGFIIRIDGLR